MPENFANRYQTTLAAGVTSGDLTGTVTTATGVPAVPFRAIISAEGANTDEILLVTGRTGTTLTWTRAAEAIAGVQAASAHALGATLTAIVTATALNAIVTSVWSPWMAYADLVRRIPGCVGYWRLGEASGTVAAQEIAAYPALADDFDRVDQAFYVSPTGHQWSNIASGGAGLSIISGRLSKAAADGHGYAWTDLGAVPARMGGNFSFAGAASEGVALLCAAAPSFSTIGVPLIHAYVTPSHWYLQVASNAGAWPTTLVTIADGAMTTATDGTSFPFYLAFDGNDCTITLPDGTEQTFTDARFGTYPGRYGCWECLAGAGSAPSRWDDIATTAGPAAQAAGLYVGGPTLGVAGAIFNDTDTAMTTAAGKYMTPGPSLAAWNDVSIACWVKTAAAGINIAASKYLGSGEPFWLGINSGTPTFSCHAVSATSAASIADGSWHLLVGTRTAAGDVRVWADGVVGATPGADSGQLIPDGNLAFGCFGDAGSFPFDGSLDDVALFSRVLSGAEIRALYETGSGA